MWRGDGGAKSQKHDLRSGEGGKEKKKTKIFVRPELWSNKWSDERGTSEHKKNRVARDLLLGGLGRGIGTEEEGKGTGSNPWRGF